MTARPAPALWPPAEEALRRVGLRVTNSRRAVYDALREMPHASADRLFDRIRGAVHSSSMQSVYNALDAFEATGLARRIEPAGGPRLFELRVGDNHHHLVCSSCGAVHDVDCVVGTAPCLAPSDSHGYQIGSAEITFWGVCSDCSGRPPRPGGPFDTHERFHTPDPS